jgi:hypothetical protein
MGLRGTGPIPRASKGLTHVVKRIGWLRFVRLKSAFADRDSHAIIATYGQRRLRYKSRNGLEARPMVFVP